METKQLLSLSTPLSFSNFDIIKKSEFRPPHNQYGLELLREKAKNEKNMRELYHGRAPYELLQNADDAGAAKAVFILLPDGLAFLHNGRWFSVDNFVNLAKGWSDKAPDQCIGHKGLGFRSVLDITPSPFLVKLDKKEFFCVRFSWFLNHGHIQETLQKEPGCRPKYEKWTQHGEAACPIMYIPGISQKKNLGQCSTIYDMFVTGKYSSQYTTLFWFPAKDLEPDNKTIRELNHKPIVAGPAGRQSLLKFINGEVSALLPFLKSVREVSVFENDLEIASALILKDDERQQDGQLTVVMRPENKSRSYFKKSFFIPIPPAIRNKPDTPKALKQMDKVCVTLSALLANGKPIHDDQASIYVYFPTKEFTGVGFLVHGDFHVMPDRTRLMDGDYNDWLLEEAAKYAASEFLTDLLGRYDALSVFEALAPQKAINTSAARAFVDFFGKWLTKRAKPFVPSADGSLMNGTEIVIPPNLGSAGFWAEHFSDILPKVMNSKESFISPTVEGLKARAFLSLAEVKTLREEELLHFIEVAAETPRSASWWYECYCFITRETTLSGRDPSYFRGRTLLPVSETDSVPVSEDSGDLIVCMPPKGETKSLQVPLVFSSIFRFLKTDLAEMILAGEDTIKHWVQYHFHVASFEATDLLPKAIRGIVRQLFDGSLQIKTTALVEIWTFVKRILDSSRVIADTAFWNELGRLPVPTVFSAEENVIGPQFFIPAFLAYWPDSFLPPDSCLQGITSLSRVDAGFMDRLCEQSGARFQDWYDFFTRIGISATPVVRKYMRVIGKEEVQLRSRQLTPAAKETFSGERQRDENKAVLKSFNNVMWNNSVQELDRCGHSSAKVLQSLTLIEGMEDCTELAETKFSNDDPGWSGRLGSLLKSISELELSSAPDDFAHCQGGGKGGHSFEIGSYVKSQLDYLNWVPSSRGPVSRIGCFARRPSGRLISATTAGEELGDLLLPYVVVDDLYELSRLQQLGIEVLEDVNSTSPEVLVRALMILGKVLSTEWGRREILDVRRRWRLVRGAVQEIYRALNQHTRNQPFHVGEDEISYACRGIDAVEFLTGPPIYYAEPGSAFDKAFRGVIPLFDADRPFPGLFDTIGVIRLVSDETVKEELAAQDSSCVSTQLYDDIVNGLAPFLLSSAIAKSERPRDDLILKVLKERFQVKTSRRLNVSFSLVANGTSIQRTLDFEKFYLQRRVIQSGIIKEAHFTLHVLGDDTTSFNEIDADALGEAISPIFADAGSEVINLFPRIASRYQQLVREKGRTHAAEAMADFMYSQLHISKEAQECAFAMTSEETNDLDSSQIPVPPAAKLVLQNKGSVAEGYQKSLQDSLSEHRERLNQRVKDIVHKLDPGLEGQRKSDGDRSESVALGSKQMKLDQVSAEQAERGRRGEEEIKRRLKLPGGYEGFMFIDDTRDKGCGYDFLCNRGESKTKLEVKTFTSDGRVIVTTTELQEAAASSESYWLVGMLDNKDSPYKWRAFFLQNPIHKLLTAGKLDVTAELKAAAADIFSLVEESGDGD